MNAPDAAFAATSRPTLFIDAWIDLFAASVARSGALGHGLAVVLTDALRVMPLLESQGPVGWIHSVPCPYQDYMPVAAGQPAPRMRIDASSQPADASRTLRRASLCLAAVSADRDAANRTAALAAQALQARASLLLFGAPQAPGWAAFEGVVRQGALQPIEASGAQVLASAGLAGALGSAGINDVERAIALASQLSKARQADLHAERLDNGQLKLRLRIDPVHLAAAGSATLAHHIAHEGRALFNGRGLGAFVVPWGAPCQARLLLRNVRARIDSLQIAIAGQSLSPLAVDYTDFGAFLKLALPAIAPGREALLHLSLPRDAVPNDGFCDVGAAEFTLETA